MYIVAIAWIYVILMMSITEESIVAGVMTLLLYGVLPLVIILYLGGTARRKRRRALAAAQALATHKDSPASVVDNKALNRQDPDAE